MDRRAMLSGPSLYGVGTMKKSPKIKTCIECGSEFSGRSNSSKVCSNYCAFWKLFDRSGGPDACWPWMGGISKDTGYGIVSARMAGGKRTSAHRRAWSLHNLCDPDQLFILHRCDNRKCGNPAHLRLGTQRANLLDAWNKGRPIRTALGEDHPLARLNADAVRAIRLGGKISDLARQYGVN
jgi:hypothetical protein